MTERGNPSSEVSASNTDRWIPTVLALLLLLGALLVWYTFVNINRIREALATEVLEQQHDVEELITDFSNVLLALNTQRLSPTAENEAQLHNSLDKAQLQLELMRSNYSFERLDGATKAHAYVKPILEDADQWLSWGIGNYAGNSPEILDIIHHRLFERLNALRDISAETHKVANELIDEQEIDLALFRDSLLIQLLAFLAVSSGVIYLLLRQRKLQHQMVEDQKQNASRFREFASIGADWFWETDSAMRLTTDTNYLGSESDSHSNAHSQLEELDTNDNGVSLSNRLLPLNRMQDKKGFANHESTIALPDSTERDYSISARPVLNESGDFVGYRGVARDITRRKRIERELERTSADLVRAESKGRQKAEGALKASEQFLRTTIDSLSQRILILDNTGTIVETNRSLEESSPYNVDSSEISWKGQKFENFFKAQPKIRTIDNTELLEFDSLFDVLRKVANKETDPLQLEFSTGSAHDPHWYVMHAQPLSTEDSNYTLLVFADVTATRNLEEQDRRLRNDLAHAARITTAGEMASGLAHELNQPFTAISHNCDAISLLLEVYKDVPDDMENVLSEALSDIATQTQRAGDIIRTMRQMIRKDSPALVPMDLKRLVEDTLRLTQPEAKEKNVEVVLKLADNLPQVVINPVQVQQVLVNLERNGVESTAANNTKERILEIHTQQLDENYAIVSVLDSGPGFDPEIKDQLFTSFLTTKRNGMGLGLSISRSIVEAHGGRIWLDTNSPMTCINFTLPFVKPV